MLSFLDDYLPTAGAEVDSLFCWAAVLRYLLVTLCFWCNGGEGLLALNRGVDVCAKSYFKMSYGGCY
jgi:hypothetical protein